jgi:hypothetical protein
VLALAFDAVVQWKSERNQACGKEGECLCVCIKNQDAGEFVYVSVSVVCVGWHSMHLPRLLLMGDECAVDGSRWQ